MDMCAHLVVAAVTEPPRPWWAWQTLPWAALSAVVFVLLRHTHT